MLDKEVKRGGTEMLILALVEDRPRHGYEIAKLIEERSDGVLQFVDERPDARTVADDRHPALADEINNRAILRDSGARPVEDPIAQGKCLQVY